MKQKHTRLLSLTLCVVTAVLSLPGLSHAADSGTTFFFSPSCPDQQERETGLFGEVPDIDGMIRLGNGRCFEYQAEDPENVRTNALQHGDMLEFDIVVRNSDRKKIQRIRGWLSYDPSVLEGVDISISPRFPNVTPGEQDFDATNGQAMLDASTNEGSEISDEFVKFARVTFKVIDTPLAGTAISFFDIGDSGHTLIEDDSGSNILNVDPSSLKVIFSDRGRSCTVDTDCNNGTCENGQCSDNPGSQDGSSCVIDSQCASGMCTDGICGALTSQPDGSPCGADNECQSGSCVNFQCTSNGSDTLPDGASCSNALECRSGVCLNGTCGAALVADGGICQDSNDCLSGNCLDSICQSGPGGPRENGDSCTLDIDCLSNNCVQDICEPVGTKQNGESCIDDRECLSGTCEEDVCIGIDSGEGGFLDDLSTAFSMLQVQGLRIATESDAVYLAWDKLASSALKGYNIYYGTVSGRYIHRQSVSKDSMNTTIKNLPEGSTYYFAIRAVNQNNEESAFSQEVSIVVGDPASSSAPFGAGDSVSFDTVDTTNAFQGSGTVPGNTGAPSSMTILLIIAASVGTIAAVRKQMLLS